MTVTSPLGQVIRDDDGMRLEFVRTYDEPVEGVWSALTEPDRVARWIGPWTGDPSSGSVDLVMTAEDGDPAQQVTILSCEPPTLLVVELSSPDGPWKLSAELHETDGSTTLRFVQRLAEPYDASDIGPGWHFYLDRLGAAIDGSLARGSFDDYYPRLKDAYSRPA